MRRTGRRPLTLDLDAFRRRPRLRRRASVFGDGRTNVLFVGRIIPNKKIEDLIRVFRVLPADLRSEQPLLLVGDHWGYEPYLLFLQAMARELGAQEVLFTGQAEDDELRAYYSVGTVYVSMSEHEGFGVPLLEAMAFGMPVARLRRGGGGGDPGRRGVLLKDKRPDEVAPLLDRLVRDRACAEAILRRPAARLDEVRATDVGARLLAQLRPVLER
jgi:glycosyltransferase involved in cell wall biosynthesis